MISSSFAKVSTVIFIGTVLLAGSAFSQTISVLSGDGQILSAPGILPIDNPLTVIVRDSGGNPIPNATVTWSVAPAGQEFLTKASAQTTDANGKSTMGFGYPSGLPGNTSFLAYTVTAATGTTSTKFVVTVEGYNSNTGLRYLQSQTLHPTPIELPLVGQAGTQAAVPIQIQISAVGGDQINSKVPHVLMTVTQESGTQATATCAGGSVFTDVNGIATCNVVFGGKIGNGVLDATTSLGTASFNFRVSAGPPAVITVLSGDKQTGTPGQILPLPLLAQVTDIGGNILSGVNLTFSAPVANSVTFSDIRTPSDSSGLVSARVTPGNVGGPVTVRVSTADGKVFANFTVNVNFSVGAVTASAGNQQSAQIGKSFTDPLIVKVTDTNGNALPNAPVTFAVTQGSATLGTASTSTASDGTASTTVTAGTTPGPVTVTATVGTTSTQFSLTVLPPGPSCDPTATFFNGAGFQVNYISPGGIAKISCSGIATNIQGVVQPELFGPMPYQIAGVSVTFGDAQIPAPMYYLANLNGQESMSVQVPVETPVGSQPVTITVNGVGTTVNANILAAAPGVFDYGDAGSDGKRMAIVLRPDGSVVSDKNPIHPGETGRAFVTGLIPPAGLTTDMLTPLGSDIAITTPVIVGLNYKGVPTVSVTYAENMVGIWVVEFKVPSNVTTGARVPFDLGVPTGGHTAFAEGSVLNVQ